MDDLARFNKERWEALAQADIEYSRPVLDLDAEHGSENKYAEWDERQGPTGTPAIGAGPNLY